MQNQSGEISETASLWEVKCRLPVRELECLFHSKGVDMRDVINRLRRGGVPIASNQNGYFYAATQQEILDTIALLTRQISGITATITGLRYSLSRIDISGFLLQQKDRDAIE